MILTTYGTVMADRRRGSGILHQVDWYRLVLDEGEQIKECRIHCSITKLITCSPHDPKLFNQAV